MDAIFVDPTTLPHTGGGGFQLFFLAAAYGFILFKASGLIATGSEMLMLVFNPGLIGGLLLPVLGAVPDGAIVLFSGTAGDKTVAQQQLSVGVGTLAGSTIMLLTIPWAACILLGRVDLNADGKTALYSKRPKLTKGWSLTRTGVQATSDVPANAWIMMATALTYIIVQAPAWANNMTAARSAALASLIISAVCFIGYSLYQVWSARSLEAQQRRQVLARTNALASHMIDIATLTSLESDEPVAAASGSAPAGEAAAAKGKVSTVALRRLFNQYDADGNGSLSKAEVRAMFREMGCQINNEELEELMQTVGGADKLVQFDEFTSLVHSFQVERDAGRVKSTKQVTGTLRSVSKALKGSPETAGTNQPLLSVNVSALDGVDGTLAAKSEGALHELEEEVEEELEEEEENEHANLSPFQIKLRAYSLLLLGVGAVTLFSDPMVGVLTEVGTRLNIAPFYISFIVTPLVSNASELISSIVFASRKTEQSITLTFSALLGAATMNNTFCLTIFLSLVYFRGLEWKFSAEVTSILVVEFIVFLVALMKTTPSWRAIITFSLYPLSLIIVFLMEQVAGLD